MQCSDCPHWKPLPEPNLVLTPFGNTQTEENEGLCAKGHSSPDCDQGVTRRDWGDLCPDLQE